MKREGRPFDRAEEKHKTLGNGATTSLPRLTAMLLKRDQIWFQEILAAENLRAFQGRQDPAYFRVLARAGALVCLRPGGTNCLFVRDL
jgi:hypothetical protein